MRKGKLTLLFICLFILFSGCGKKIEKKIEEEVIPVRVVTIQPQRLDISIEYVGDIRAFDEVVVYPKVSGKIIEKIKEDGQSVAKGEAIAYIDRDEVGLKFEKAPVESPLAGVIGRVYVDIGTYVNVQTPVALVVNMDKVKILLEIPEKYLPKISLEQEASIYVDAYPTEEFQGKVTKISPVVDLATRSAPVEISLDNPDHRLKSGMFARVKLVIDSRENAFVILKEAVIGQEPDTYVYVVKEGRAVLEKVTLGIRQGPYYEVKDGLKEKDLVVIVGQQKLYENAPVKMEE